jgi:hypothetical protein
MAFALKYEYLNVNVTADFTYQKILCQLKDYISSKLGQRCS